MATRRCAAASGRADGRGEARDSLASALPKAQGGEVDAGVLGLVNHAAEPL